MELSPDIGTHIHSSLVLPLNGDGCPSHVYQNHQVPADAPVYLPSRLEALPGQELCLASLVSPPPSPVLAYSRFKKNLLKDCMNE